MNTEFKVWKTIRLGIPGEWNRSVYGEPSNDLAEQCRRVGPAACKVAGISRNAVGMVADPEFARNVQEELDLVIVDPKEVGCTSSGFMDICQEIKTKTGLLECPPEVGPQLYFQWIPGEAVDLVKKRFFKLHVAMKAIDLSKGSKFGPSLYHFYVFINFVSETDGNHIYGPCLNIGCEDETLGCFIFVKPRKQVTAV